MKDSCISDEVWYNMSNLNDYKSGRKQLLPDFYGKLVTNMVTMWIKKEETS